MHLKTITELLALPNFQVVKMLEQTETRIHLLVELIELVEPVCSACGMVHHTPIHSIGWIRSKLLHLISLEII